jgi:glycosyltransferase involved in cell wall biosynthesis
MVVLCFLPESVGGSELYTYHLSRELASRGHEVVVVAGIQDMAIDRYTVIDTTFEGLRVVKIANSNYYARSFRDFFIDETIDGLFREILLRERPDVVHFQHLPFLSGNLPGVAHELGIPSLFTIHDYWYMCFRSQLIRPGLGPCPGPDGGRYCASCHDAVMPNPSVEPRFGLLARAIRSRGVAKLNPRRWLSPQIIRRLKAVLYKPPVSEDQAASPEHGDAVREHVFRLEFFRQALGFPRFVLSPSRHLKQRYEEAGFREILHVPLGFYPADEVPRPPFEGTLKIAYLGNIVPFKGAHVILREVLRLPDPARAEVHIYGRPVNEAYHEEVTRLALELPEGSVVLHGGYRSDKELQEILSTVHLVVFPSLWEENYPLVVRETLLHGVPVVGSTLGGVPEAIEDGVNGFLFDPYREGDLAEKLERLLETPLLLDAITEGARRSAIETMEHHVERVVGLYDDALRQGTAL